MKRSAKIYIIVLIWGAALIQLFFNSRVKIEDEVIQTFVASDISEYETEIFIWGEYGDSFYDEKTVRNILVHTAAEFGITDNYMLSNQSGIFEDRMLLRAQNREQAPLFQFVTEHESGKSFLVMQMTLSGKESSETEPMRMLEDFYEGIGIDYRKSISVRGSRTGRLRTEEMDEIARDILDKIGGKYVCGGYLSAYKSGTSEDMLCPYMIYGYTKDLPVSTYIEDQKVNIRVIFDYDPTERTTGICVKFVY